MQLVETSLENTIAASLDLGINAEIFGSERAINLAKRIAIGKP